MQRFIKFLAFVAVISGLMAETAMAEEDSGSTNCYIFKKNKLIKESACHYTANIDSSLSYAINEYTYRVPKIGKLVVIDNYSEGIADANGTVTFKSETHTINGKKAVNRFRNPKSYAIYSDKQLNAKPALMEDGDCKIFCVNLIIKHKFTQENINERFNRSFA